MRFTDGQGFPPATSIIRVLKALSLEETLDAVDITADRFGRADSHAVRYFFGVCWRKVDQRVPQ